MHRAVVCALTLCSCTLILAPALEGYSVLTHEAIIDSAWEDSIQPLLLERFPQSTPAELTQAHSYAYAGCILQDMGYYPFGNHFFSDLTHYVRSGEFVMNMIRDAQDLDEYAFALGSLAHYAADTQGHSIAVNPSVAIQYPKLRQKFGNIVTYADDHSSHLKVEFSFDVLQVSRGNYAPQSYHDFVGFRVSKPVLERAFHDTYALELADIFTDLDLALGTYRRAVSFVIPEMTRVAWHVKKDELTAAQPSLTRRRFIYNVSRASYHKEWGRDYRGPGLGTRFVAFLIRILPKVGPLRALSFKTPTSQTAVMFEDSFDGTLDLYRRLLREVHLRRLDLVNRDFDTGKPTEPAEYRLADDAYAKLAVKLADKDPASIPPALRDTILAFFRNRDLPYATKKNARQWQETLVALDKLKAQPAGALQ